MPTLDRYDYTILHRNCTCRNDGWVQDAIDAGLECRICDGQFGFNVPITTGDGELIAHLSCEIERDYANA